jgi:hypothetical protein
VKNIPSPIYGWKTEHPLYATWRSMRDRSNCKTDERYADYGGRGIKVCPEWDDFWVFVEDMGEKPSPMHTLDRIDNDKGYSKDNCRWATKLEQTENRRTRIRCKRGHPRTPDVTLVVELPNGRSKLMCKICVKQSRQERYLRKKKECER